MSAKDLSQLIRPLKQRQATRKQSRRVGPVTSRALRSIEAALRIETEIVAFLDGLREAIPQLTPRRRFYDGAWQVGVSADLPCGKRFGRDYKAFSRLIFDISRDPEDPRHVFVECRTTAHDRDRPTTWVRCDSEHDLAELQGFVERACLEFALHFFDSAQRS